MNLRPFIFVPLLGLHVSCDTLNEPVYYGSNGQVVEKQQAAQAPIAPVQQTTAQVPTYTTAPAAASATQMRNSPPSSPFMQPDVLGLPAKEDLKETSTSTPSGGSSGGLTVPGR